MKKILSILLIVFFALNITGCGVEKKQEFTDNMKEMRSYSAGYIDNKTLGEVLDIAINDAKWEEVASQGATKSGKIIVTGKDKNTNKEVKLTWKTTKDMYEDNGFLSFIKDGENLTYGDFLDYLKSYVEKN